MEAAVLAELEQVGPEAFGKAAIWRQFKGQGAGRSTVYRWMDELLMSGRAGQHLVRRIQEAAEARAARTAEPAADAAREAAAALPAVVRPEDIAGAGGTLAAIEKLQACIRAAEQVMAYARTEDGRVRNVKALLAASEHLRRSLETAIKMRIPPVTAAYPCCGEPALVPTGVLWSAVKDGGGWRDGDHHRG